MAFSPDGLTVLTGSADETARLWDAETGKELKRFAGSSGSVESVAFSPDGRTVLTGGDDMMGHLWDVKTSKELRRLTGHSESVSSVAFSPDGRRMLTGSEDGTTKLWDASSGIQLASLVGFNDGGWAIVDPAGHYDASDPDNSSSLYWVTSNLRTIDLARIIQEV